MKQFFIELAVTFLLAYLAFINMLSTHIQAIFYKDTDEAISYQKITSSTSNQSDYTIQPLPSKLGSFIPDILINSPEFQQASLVGTTALDGHTTNNLLDAIVNIFCTFTTDDYIRTTTGTGFFINANGVIITNAHVAQFLLLEKSANLGQTDCIIRSGNPATPHYRADLLYISPAWVHNNSNVINEAKPMGTGERDYALLYVYSSMDNTPLPAVFPALAFNSEPLPISAQNTNIALAGYPASDLFVNGPNTDLIAKQASSSISELYTFGSNLADVISIKGSVVGAEGASGGPVVNDQNQVIGMIVTRGDDNLDGIGSLRAITLSHIDRTIKQETGFSLNENLKGNLPYRAKIFSDTMSPFLISILEQSSTDEN